VIPSCRRISHRLREINQVNADVATTVLSAAARGRRRVPALRPVVEEAKKKGIISRSSSSKHTPPSTPHCADIATEIGKAHPDANHLPISPSSRAPTAALRSSDARGGPDVAEDGRIRCSVERLRESEFGDAATFPMDANLTISFC